MIWLQSPPWLRWALAVAIALTASWIELRPQPSIEHPFAIVSIERGDLVTGEMVEMRLVPSGLFDPVELEGFAMGPIAPGEPILASEIGAREEVVAGGWWVIEVALPVGAKRGDRAEVVLLDSDATAEAVVVRPTETDTFGSLTGAVAVAPAHAAEVARASAEGRATIMLAPT